MLELGVFMNGQTDLPVRQTPTGTVLPSGSLADMHASYQRGVLNQIKQGVLAEKLGFDYLWPVEHHFQPEGAEFSPNPMLMEMAVAAQTSRIRLGQYANILTWWHPLRIAEQAAMLDVVSGGRVEFGLGRGYQPREVEVFGRTYGSTIQDQERNRSSFEEALELLLKAWTEPSFSHHGENFSIPPLYTKWHHNMTIELLSQPGYERSVEQVLKLARPDMYASGNAVIATPTILKELSVFPQPLQKPHPQLWMPLTSERSIRWASARGMNGGFIVEPTWALKRNVETYYDEAEKQGWPDYQNRGQFKYGWDAERKRGVMVLRPVVIMKDPRNKKELERVDLGTRLVWSYLGPFGFVALTGKSPEDKVRSDTPVSLEYLVDREVVFLGTSEQAAEQILKMKNDCGFDDFNFAAQFELAGFSNEEIEEQMHLFAEEVVPILRRECGPSPWAAAELVAAGNGRP